jgi:hypothetical protein
MDRVSRLFRRSLLLCVLLVPVLAQAYPSSVEVIPAAPGELDLITARLLGDMPDPCHAIVDVAGSGAETIYTVTLTIEDPEPSTNCIMVLEPYERRHEMGRFTPGEYRVVFVENRVLYGTNIVYATAEVEATFTVTAANVAVEPVRWSRLKALYDAR